MRKEIVTSIIAILFFTLLLGIVYPLVITGVSQVTFPGNANGQKVYVRRQAGRLQEHRPELPRAR